MDLNVHGTEEQLELYVRGKLSDSDLAVLEEHLFVCDSCRERLDETEQTLGLIYSGLKAEPVSTTGKQSWPAFIWGGAGWLRSPAFAAAMAIVLILGGIGYYSRNHGSLAPVAVIELTAMRGEMATAKAAKELDLTLTDAPQGVAGDFRVQIVDSGGAREWEGTATSGSNGIELRIQQTFRAGSHLVRLFDPKGQLVHEYGFVLGE